MSFNSYAQNFEDVMLWRALKHIDKGCYIDVGAQHPIIDSVSKAFYEHGWRGIHIEPVPHYAELLRQDRPDETVLEIALSDTEGSLELNVIAGTGLSTAVDAYAQRHQTERLLEHQRISVPARTLKSALQPLAGKQVHWLKIDVEGFETQVLKGWDSEVLRPWVMVVEATVPDSSQTDYAVWDDILAAAHYRFVYFDGLNRYYIAHEHSELAAAFASPPNVFDDIKLTENSALCSELVATHHARIQALSAHAVEAAARAAQAEARAVEVAARAAQVEARAAQAEAHLAAILNSRTWRATEPLRQGLHALRKVKHAFMAGTLLERLKKRSKRLLPRREMVSSPNHLSPRTARIYAELKKATATKKP